MYVYNWMASLFDGHSHCTIFADNVSLFAEIFASVIQGSGVGPVSYIVCASDLHPLTPANKMFKFADDTCLVIPASHIHTRELELLNVENWATQNNLNLNRAKSQEIVFEKPRSRNKLTVPSLPGVARVDSLKILGVNLGSNFSLQDHITAEIASSGQALYALRILRSHGLGEAEIQTVFRSTVQAKLLYASPAWWGFANSAQRDRLESFLRRSAKAGFHPPGSPTFSELCDISDETLFRAVMSDPTHPLHQLLPPKVTRTYNLRTRNHPYLLPDKGDSLHQCNFMIRCLYKDIY